MRLCLLPPSCFSTLVAAVLVLPAGGMGATLPKGSPAAESLLPGSPADSARLSAGVDSLFQPWHRPDSPGAAVLVIQGGRTVHARGYGMANLEHGVPMGTTTVLDIASVSKQFGAFAVALLAAEGRLDPDDPVRRHIPELPEWAEGVTLRHLVHHTGGLRDWPGTLGMGGWDFQDIISYDQILRMALHQEELNFPPGSEYAYSNTGYNLLAEVVTRVTGQSFRDWSREQIFEPLGMTRTHVQDDHTEVTPGRADSYAPRGDGRHRRITNNLTALASSSMHTTVEDLARWILNFRDPQVGDRALLDRMEEPGTLTTGDTIPYAWGQVVEGYRGAYRVGHTGSWAGYRSVLHRYPDLDFAVAILANTAEMIPAALAEEVADLYLGEHLDPLPVEVLETIPGEPPAADAPVEWIPGEEGLQDFTGAYRSSELDTTWRLRVEDGGLVARHFRLGDRPFLPVEPDRFQAPGFGEIRFLRDARGRVTAFTATSARIRDLRFLREP
jgi:CubicO group peptidase (beta-lactamase class C family)